MQVKNKRGLLIGIMTLILAIIGMIAYFKYLEKKFIISSILLIALSAVNFIRAFSKKGALEELAEHADERDLFLVMKSSHIVIKAMNYVICGFVLISLLLYAICKYQYFIVIAATLSAVLVLMFIIYLTVNVYLEKRE